MKRKLVFATNNAHKLEEVAAILGEKIELFSLNDIGCHTDISETAATLEGNALLKSSFIFKNYGLDCFADDTGLEVEALDGAPGVYSARYAGGEGHDSQANMLKLLRDLEGKENRKAQFRTAISLILDGKEYLFEGVIKGEIIKEKRGDSGFGYDPIFKPEGYDKTFAELGNDIKNKISHRALAVQKLCEFLQR
ncbi:non-canonical purine NTP diphosphatase [Bacteroides congonensis]|uniref:non-canonical purine NTP diphosphatase n=1 Tax=Bacteroides congonensis TaxID=1871006 RepID=UPI00189944E1|nr:non-canonical purine NTP diphosphatase [Bacteroides congonensis]